MAVLVVGVGAVPAGASHDIYDLDHPCSVSATVPSMSSTTEATSIGNYTCPNPHKHMTVIVWIEVFTPAYGYQTVASEKYTMGTTPSDTVFGWVTGTVCIKGALTMKAKATGYWIDSHGNIKGTRHYESLATTVKCVTST